MDAGEPFQQRRRIRHRPARVGFEVAQAVHGGNPGGAPLFLGEQAAPAHRDDGYPGRHSGRGHAGRRLAAEGLLVQRPLTGDDQPAPANCRWKPTRSRIRSMPGRSCAPSRAIAAKPTPPAAPAPGRPGSRCRWRRRPRPPSDPGHRRAGRCRRVTRPSAGRRPRRRRAARSADCPRRRRPRSRRRPGRDAARSGRAGRSRRAPPAVGDLAAVGVQQPGAQRADQAGAAVGAGAAADAEHDAAGNRRPARRRSPRRCPRLLAVSGARPLGRRDNPEMSAISTTARSPSLAYDVATGNPVGPDAVTGTDS